MLSPVVSFGNLAPPELGLVCATVLLLFEGPGVRARRRHSRSLIAAAQREDLWAFGAGATTALVLAAVADQGRSGAPILVAVSVAAVVVLLAQRPSRPPSTKMRWRLGTLAMFLLAWSLMTAIVEYWLAR